MKEQGSIIRYSRAFKLKVVNEIEEGKYSITQARDIYDIGGGDTIHKWIKRLGRNHLISKIVRVEMRGETDKIKELNKKIRVLESALANERIKTISLESLMEVAEERYGVEFKKNSSAKGLKEAKRK